MSSSNAPNPSSTLKHRVHVEDYFQLSDSNITLTSTEQAQDEEWTQFSGPETYNNSLSLAESVDRDEEIVGTAHLRADNDRWKSKLVVKAVECALPGLAIEVPPFPFKHPWQMRRKKTKQKRKDCAAQRLGSNISRLCSCR